ncbi:14241_t:CDS:2, partial [Dentiscutata erythropus]
KKIAKEHPSKIFNYFINNQNYMHVFNIDDYHSIHSYRRPNATSLSEVHHMATCVTKRINDCIPISATHNGISFFNPLNIDASLINRYLLEKYNGIFDISYNTRKFQWSNQTIQNFQQFDRIELLTIHIYDDAIAERKAERSMET